MPGKQYRYTILKGPFRGKDCRIVKQDADRDYYEVRIRPLSWRYKPLSAFIRSDYLQAKNGHRPEAGRRPTK